MFLVLAARIFIGAPKLIYLLQLKHSRISSRTVKIEEVDFKFNVVNQSVG